MCLTVSDQCRKNSLGKKLHMQSTCCSSRMPILLDQTASPGHGGVGKEGSALLLPWLRQQLALPVPAGDPKKALLSHSLSYIINLHVRRHKPHDTFLLPRSHLWLAGLQRMGKEILQLLLQSPASCLSWTVTTWHTALAASPLAQLLRLAQLARQWRDSRRHRNKLENVNHKKRWVCLTWLQLHQDYTIDSDLKRQIVRSASLQKWYELQQNFLWSDKKYIPSVVISQIFGMANRDGTLRPSRKCPTDRFELKARPLARPIS